MVLIGLLVQLGIASCAFASYQDDCEKASGHYKAIDGIDVCLCGGLKKPINPSNAEEVAQCQAKSINPIVDQLTNINAGACPDCLQDGYANNRNNSCGQTLLGEMLADDKTASFMERVLPTASQVVVLASTGMYTVKPVINEDMKGLAVPRGS